MLKVKLKDSVEEINRKLKEVDSESLTIDDEGVEILKREKDALELSDDFFTRMQLSMANADFNRVFVAVETTFNNERHQFFLLYESVEIHEA